MSVNENYYNQAAPRSTEQMQNQNEEQMLSDILKNINVQNTSV